MTYNVNKFSQEISNIKNKLNDKRSSFNIERFQDNKDEFFTGHTDVSKSMITNRNIKAMVDFVHYSTAFILMRQHGKEDEVINLDDVSQPYCTAIMRASSGIWQIEATGRWSHPKTTAKNLGTQAKTKANPTTAEMT